MLEWSTQRARRSLSCFLRAVGIAVMLLGCRDTSGPRGPLRVAAAASVADAFDELGRAFTRKTGQTVSFTFGSSGLMARQILEGAPYDVFAAADRASIERLGDGVCDASTRHVYAVGRLALWTRPSSTASPPVSLQELVNARFVRIAIANPATAPYGHAAREAMQRRGVWDALAPRIVYAENVRQALQLAETGNAEVALIARSLVFDRSGNPGVLIDDALHAPLEHELIACRGGSRTEAARAFVAFVDSVTGQALLAKHGLERPTRVNVKRPSP